MIRRKQEILAAKGGFLRETYRESGLSGCARTMMAAIKMYLPMVTLGRRTNQSVGAYFDLITDDARRFYGDSFHFGYFKNGNESFDEALSNHTDIVAEMACLGSARKVLDIGCGICAPAIRIAKKHDCHITGVNISAKQVEQGRALVQSHGLADRIEVLEGNALKLPCANASFDSLLCIEVAGDICVTESQKEQLVSEMARVLKPGGKVGFSDLVFTGSPTSAEERAMRTILYHRGDELITDWAGIFQKQGFKIREHKDIIADTMKTWEYSLSVYEDRAEEVEQRYGRKIAQTTMQHLREIPKILSKYGSFVVMSAEKA